MVAALQPDLEVVHRPVAGVAQRADHRDRGRARGGHDPRCHLGQLQRQAPGTGGCGDDGRGGGGRGPGEEQGEQQQQRGCDADGEAGCERPRRAGRRSGHALSASSSVARRTSRRSSA